MLFLLSIASATSVPLQATYREEIEEGETALSSPILTTPTTRALETRRPPSPWMSSLKAAFPPIPVPSPLPDAATLHDIGDCTCDTTGVEMR